ncbi:MAG: T9SS type A sorting domain-containing protein [Bacteroidetes bacterium]|nr:T9SS type A sorting domain-containing protein [Bacteroidota bacterium]
MTKKIILPLLLLTIISSASAQYPSINANRPRIYADSTRLAWLKDAITIPGDCQNTYTSMAYAYYTWWINDSQLYTLGSDSTLWHWDWSSQWASQQTFLSVLIYKLTNDPLELKRCRFVAQQVINRIDTADFAAMEWYAKEGLLRTLSDAGDILIDWCYDDFPPALRDQLAQRIFVMNREFMNTFIYSSAGNSYVSSHNTWNNIFCSQNALTLHDASGLSVQQKDTVNQWFRFVYDKHINGFIPCWTYYRDDDGGWNWGAAYAMWSLVDQFQLFENMRVGTDKNFYTDLPWVQNSINQYIYFIQPNNKCIHLGDGETTIYGDRVVYLHARIFNDPRSLWLAQYWSQPSMTPNTMDKYTKLLYKDFNMPVVSRPDNPLNWWSDKVGLSVSLSSWDPSATMVTFFDSPSKKAAHEHRDNNSFMLFKNKPLLLDAGYYDTYGGSHYRNYYQRTIAHNSICVYDSTDIYNCFGSPASNDGGQIESVALMHYDDIFLRDNQRGRWIKQASGTNYSYNISDAQLSYDPEKLGYFRRRLLHVKPNRVIVLDHIYLKKVLTKQRDLKWIAHFANEPVISGNLISTTVPGHILTYDGKDYSASNGNGNVSIRTLVPVNTTVTLTGGTGYEYWVDGTNYEPLVTPDTNYYTPGRWRIEVRPAFVNDSVVFFHTIEVGDNIHHSTAGGLLLKNNISLGTDWNDTLFFFSADSDTGKIYHMLNNVSGGRNAGIFAADLTKGLYDVKIDAAVVSTVSTDLNGVLQTTVTLTPGNHVVEITQPVISVQESRLKNHLLVYPNPSQTKLRMKLNDGAQLNEIEICDAAGELKIKTIKQPVDISTLSSGVYIVKVKAENKIYSAKFVKE